MHRMLSLLGLLALVLATQARPEPEVKLSAEEKKLLDLTNAERAREKLGALKPNALLLEAARAHTANMVKQGKLDHVLDGQTPADRLEKVGYAYARYAENIVTGTEAKPEDAIRVWMESPLHKANLLNGEYEEIGIAWARTPKGEVYATQVFGKPRPK